MTLSDQVNKQLGTQSSKLEKLESENKALSQFLSEVEAVRNRYMREIDELKRSVQNENKARVVSRTSLPDYLVCEFWPIL